MSKQLNLRRPILIFSLMACFMLASASSINMSSASVIAAMENKCATVTKEDLVKSIYDQVKIKYEGQRTHINVSVKENIVTLDGWATTKEVKKEIEKYAKKTKCVKKVINYLSVGPGAGCTRQQVKCGDICISGDRDCNL